MKLKRAILTGLLLWVLIFFEVSVLMFGFKLEGTFYYTVHFVLLTVLVIIAGLVYFKPKSAGRGFFQGLLIGIIFVIVGIILDSIITIPLFMQADYSFLIRSDILLGSALIILITGIIGATKR